MNTPIGSIKKVKRTIPIPSSNNKTQISLIPIPDSQLELTLLNKPLLGSVFDENNNILTGNRITLLTSLIRGFSYHWSESLLSSSNFGQ